MPRTILGFAKDHVILAKFVFALVILWTSGLLVGTSILTRGGLRLSHPVLVAQVTPLSEDHTLVAVHTEKLDQITKENQAGIDDRKELHAAIATLTDRLNVDEAQFKTTGWIFGGLFSLFSGVSTLMAILEYRGKRRQWHETGSR